MKRIISILTAFFLLSTCFVINAASEENEFVILRQKWYQMATGGSYDPTDPRLQDMLTSINNEASDYLNRMNKNPNPSSTATDYLWTEYPLGNRGGSLDSNNIHFSYESLKRMARAHEMPGTTLYKNEELRAEIIRGLEYLYDNHFHPGLTSLYSNWFSWRIGAPLYLCETTLLMQNYLPAETVQKYSVAARQYLMTNATGANALWTLRVRLYTGMLEESEAQFTYIANEVPSHLKYVTSGDGYHTDGTFIQHNTVTYNGGYGNNALSDITHFMYILNGTKWQLSDSNLNNIYDIIYNTYEPIMYEGLCMDAFRGREITRTDSPDVAIGCALMGSILMASKFAPAEDSLNYKAMLKEWTDSDYVMNMLTNSAQTPWFMFPAYTLNEVLKIQDDESVPMRSTKGKHYQYQYGARVMHNAEDFTYVVSMMSPRIVNFETGDSNTRGFNTGLGMTYLYNSDLEQFGGLNKATIDWYRLPGVTTRNTTPGGSNQVSSKTWVGGTTLNDKYGAAGMEFAATSTNVTGKKSWFMFDDEVVALGSNISDAGASKPVETTIENRMLTGAADNKLIVNGIEQPTALGTSQKLNNVDYLFVEGNVPDSDFGIYFPEKTTLNALRETRTGKWTNLGGYNTDTSDHSANWLTLWTDHGTNPQNAKYSYVVLPNKSPAEVANYVNSSDIKILRNDTDAHAVYERNLNIVAANFWNDKANILDTDIKNYIYVDKKSSIMVKEKNDNIDISISDPTWENSGSINVEINRAAKGVLTKDSRIQVLQTSPTIKLKVDVNGARGQEICASLSFSSEGTPNKAEITSFRTLGNVLEVTLANDINAKGFVVKYGESSGGYTKTATTYSNNVVKIYGLDLGKTYYFVAAAIDNKDYEGIQSEEYSAKIEEKTKLDEPFADFSKILSQSGVWSVDPANPQNAGGDSTKIKRDEVVSTDTLEYIIYHVPGAMDFNLKVADYKVSSTALGGKIEVFGSSDNSTWVKLNSKVINLTDPTTIGNNSWYMKYIQNDGSLPDNINFIKIEVSNNSKIWAPQLLNLEINHDNDTSNRILYDDMLSTSRTFDMTGNVKYAYITDNSFDSDRGLATKTNADTASIIYSVADMTSFSSTVFQVSGGQINFSYSINGTDYVPVTAPEKTTLTTNKVGYDKFRYSFSGLPSNVKYLKVDMLGNTNGIYLSDLQINYKDTAVPIERIHFEDKNINGVINANIVPVVKIAPMNGYGEITYESDNSEIADYTTETLSPKAIGNAGISVTVNEGGTDKADTASIRVFNNIGRGKTASGTSASGYPASYAVDGNLATRWQASAYNSPLTIDLGKTETVNAIQIFWQVYGKDFKIQSADTNTDSTIWNDVYATNASEGGEQWIEFTTPIKARYFRILGLTSGARYSIFEFRILAFSTAVAIEAGNLALNKPCVESNPSSKHSNDVALVKGNAFDGSTSTRWGSPRSDNQWIYVDLGGDCTITDLNILWEGAYGKTYQLQVSDDASSWTTVVDEKSGSSGWKYYKLATPVTGRYVKMNGLTRGTTYGFSIYEFQVMGYGNDQITKLSFDQDSYTVLVGQKIKPSLWVVPTSADKSKIAWTSSNTSVATVDGAGNVRPIKGGTAVIKAVSQDNSALFAECAINVIDYAGAPIPVESVTITNKPTGKVEPSDTFTLAATVSPVDASNKNIMWISSDKSVAIIDNSGKVTVTGYGMSTITAQSVVADNIKDSYELYVYGNIALTAEKSDQAVVAVLSNYSPASTKGILIIGAYDQNNVLFDCIIKDFSLNSFEDCNISFDIKNHPECTFKAFAWDEQNGPLCPEVIL